MLLKTVSLEHAPLVLRISRTFQFMLFILPTIILFYQYKGLTVGDFFLIQGLFSFAVFLLEIPTGYIGDLFCRKKVLVISMLVYLLGNIIWYFLSGFTFVFLGELCMATSMALYSGTAEAYLYDALKRTNREHDIIKEQGKLETLSTFGTAFATLAGGAMYQYLGADNTILIQTIAATIAVVTILLLPNIPDTQRVVEHGKSKMQDIWDITKYASTHSEIKWLMLFPAAFGSGTFIIMWGIQPILDAKGVALFMFGIFMGANQLFRGAFSHFSDKMFKKLKTNKFSVLLFAVLVAGFIASIIAPDMNNKFVIYALVLIMGFAAASQIALGIVTSSIIHHRIKSDERATVLSVKSMFARIGMGIATISVKFLIDSEGIQMTFIIIGAVILTLTIVSMVKLLKLKIN